MVLLMGWCVLWAGKYSTTQGSKTVKVNQSRYRPAVAQRVPGI